MIPLIELELLVFGLAPIFGPKGEDFEKRVGLINNVYPSALSGIHACDIIARGGIG